MLKSYGVVGWGGVVWWWGVGVVGWVAHKIFVSAQGPLVLSFCFGVWGKGLTIHLINCGTDE